MKNKKSIYFIVLISLSVGLLHFLIGPNYQGIFQKFVNGYLIDILLPMNVYLLLQISLRKNISVFLARIIAALLTFSFGTTVEILQFYDIPLFGSTFDIWDIVMYGLGTGLGVAVDLTIINRLEKSVF